MMKHSLLFFVCILISILSLGCQRETQSTEPAPSPNEAWQVYRHPVYRFTFEYPQSLDREPLIWNCGISALSDTTVSFGAVSRLEVIETRGTDLADHADHFFREHPNYTVFSTESSVNAAGLDAVVVEYSMGAPYADHMITFFASDNYVVALDHYHRAPICITETSSIDDAQIYRRAVESFNFPP